MQFSNEARTGGSANLLSSHGKGPGRYRSIMVDESLAKHVGNPTVRKHLGHTTTDQHQPCQRVPDLPRPIRENTKGLLRQYFPKSMDLSIHSPEDLEFVAQKLSRRQRKTLDCDTPAERSRELISN